MIAPDRIKKIMQKLPVPNGFRAGRPMRLMRWQTNIIDRVFGAQKRPEIVYIEIPRKNGKTTFIADLLVTVFNIDPEPGAEFYCASGDKTQAGIVYNIGDYMIRKTPEISKKIKTIPSQKKFVMRNEPTRFFASLSSDAHSKHGYNPYFTIFDELHIFKNRDLWDVMDTGDIARENPIKIIITTAGNDMSSLCGEFHEHAMAINEGRINDPTFMGFVFTVKDKDKWENEDQWTMANPSIQEEVIKIDKIRQKYLRAKGKPLAEAAFKRLHLNIWQESFYQWLDLDKIDFPKKLNIENAVGGLDLGFGGDPTSLALIDNKDGDLYVKAFVWITDSTARNLEKMHGVKFPEWIKKGYVRTYGSEIPDYEILENDILKICKNHGVKRIGYDPWKSHQLIGKLNRRIEMIPVRQGFKTMTMPIRIFENHVETKHLKIEYNPAVLQALKQTYIKEDAAGNAKPDKQKSWHKIDSVVAILDSLSILETTGQIKKSIYESRGV